MKKIKLFLALIVASTVLVSCSSLSGMSSSSNSLTGSTTGSALASLYNILKTTGTLDLGNLNTLINLGKVLNGANSLVDASQSYTNTFASGLISGSSNLITNSNVGGVMSGLKSLAGTDTSALTKLTTSALAGSILPSSSVNTGEVNSSVNAIKSILSLMK